MRSVIFSIWESGPTLTSTGTGSGVVIFVSEAFTVGAVDSTGAGPLLLLS